MPGQSTTTLPTATTITEVLGLADGSTFRQAISNLALQLLAQPELAAVIGGSNIFAGEWDASSGEFPAGASKGQFWRVNAAGTVDDVDFAKSDMLIALVDDASTSVTAGNWHHAAYQSFAHIHAISDVDGLRAALNGVIHAPDRPGDNLEAFSRTLTGSGASKTALDGTVESIAGSGLCFVQTGAGILATRDPVALGSDVIEFTARFRRISDPTPPNNQSVVLGVAWLNENKDLISVSTLASEANALSAQGRIDLSARVSTLAVPDVIAPPASASYAVPYVEVLGADGPTAIETLRSAEVTDLHVIESSDLSAIIAAAQAATNAANNAADLVATETLDTWAGLTGWTRPAGVGTVTFKGATAAFDGRGGQWVYDPDDTTSGHNMLNGVGVDAGGGRWKIASRLAKTVYLDSINGSDANNGMTPDTPVQTASAAGALLIDGDKLRVARNSVVYRGNFSDKKHLHVRPYGSGRRPIFTAAQAIDPADWAVYSGTIYKATIVHEVETSGSNDPAFYPQFALWDDVRDSFLPARLCGLERIADDDSGGTALATEIAALTPGSFTVRRTGADNASPYNVDASTFDYYVRLSDDADPSALTDRVIWYAEQAVTAGFGFGSDIVGVNFCRSASKDHLSGGTGSGSVGRVHDVRVIDASVHGSVMRGSTYTKYYAEKNPYATFGGAGNGLHLYRSEDIDGISRGAWCDDIEVVGFEAAVHSHGGGNDAAAFDQWEMGSIKARNCGLGFSSNEVGAAVHIKRLEVIHDGALGAYGGGEGVRGVKGNLDGANATARTYIDEFQFIGPEFDATRDSNSVQVLTGNVTVSSGFAYIPGHDSGTSPSRGLAVGAGEIILDKFTFIAGEADGQNSAGVFMTSFSADTTLTVTNSILDASIVRDDATALNASNTFLRWGGMLLTDIQAIYPGVDDDCVVPIWPQPYSHTFTAGEIVTAALGTADVTSGAAFFLATDNGLADRGNITIAGADGSGGDLSVPLPVRDAANDSGGKYAYTSSAHATFPATVTGAVVNAVSTTRVIFPDNPGTARLNRDQENLRMSDATHFTAGQLVWLDGIERRDPFGLFEVDSVSGDVATLTGEVPWKFTAAHGSSGVSYDLSSSASSTLNPSVNARFGFPIMIQGGGTDQGVEGTITYAAGGDTLDFTAQRASQTGRLTPASAQAGTSNSGGFVNAETGVFAAELAVGEGDSVSLTARIYVDEYMPKWVADPALSHSGLLSPDSIHAKRGMGYRGYMLA